MTLRAHCSACNKAYRVPHDRKPWSCKACGETLELEADSDAAPVSVEGPEPEREAAPACSACGTPHGPDARFCEDCGVDLASGRRWLRQAPGEQRAAATEMRRAVRRVGFLRAVLVLYVIQGVLLTGLSAVAVFRGGEPLLLALFFSVTLLVLSVLGLLFVNRRPFPIALAMALIDTLSLALAFAFNDVSLWGAAWGLVRVALMWGATYQAARLTALAREFPDLYQSRRLRGEHLGARGRGEGESLSRKHKGRGARTRDRSGLWLALGGVVVAALAAFFLLRPPGLPDPLPSVEGFRTAWNAGDVEAMAGFTRADRQARRRRIFESAKETYEWGDVFPEAGEFDVTREERGDVRVVMTTVGGDVPMQFEWQNERWELTSLSFKGVRAWRP